MQQTYTDDGGKRFTATISGNILTMFVPRQPEIVRIKIPARHKSRLAYAIKRTNFHAFTAAVDEVAG